MSELLYALWRMVTEGDFGVEKGPELVDRVVKVGPDADGGWLVDEKGCVQSVS